MGGYCFQQWFNDETVAIVEQYQEKRQYCRLGLTSVEQHINARNVGILRCWRRISICDADDEVGLDRRL